MKLEHLKKMLVSNWECAKIEHCSGGKNNVKIIKQCKNYCVVHNFHDAPVQRLIRPEKPSESPKTLHFSSRIQPPLVDDVACDAWRRKWDRQYIRAEMPTGKNDNPKRWQEPENRHCSSRIQPPLVDDVACDAWRRKWGETNS